MERYLTTKEVLERIPIGSTSLGIEIRTGALPSVRPGPGGRRLLIRETDLEAYMRARTVGGEPTEESSAARTPVPAARGGRRASVSRT